MITISDAISTIISRKPFLRELMVDGLINYSALARQIKPEIEKETMKQVSDEAIVMALRRLPLESNEVSIEKLFSKPVDMIVRSNLMEVTIHNSDFTHQKHVELLDALEKQSRYFLIITQSVFETTIIMSKDIKDEVHAILAEKNIVATFDNLSSITIKMPIEVVPTSGAYYYILKLLAFDNINIVEVASTYTEFTIILENGEVDKAFSILNKALKK